MTKVSNKQLMIRVQAEETRSKIYDMLKQQPMSSPDIRKALNITKEQCDHHLKVLRHGGYTVFERTHHRETVNKVIDPNVEYVMKYTRDKLTNEVDVVEIDKQEARSPHIRVIRNLSKPAPKYITKQKKSKGINPWRASSLSMFDSY